MSSTSIHVTDLIPVVVTILSKTQIPQGRKKKKYIFVLHTEQDECRDCHFQNIHCGPFNGIVSHQFLIQDGLLGIL